MSTQFDKARMLQSQCAALIGLPFHIAVMVCHRIDVCYRIVTLDGKGVMKTNDSKMERLNFHVAGGVITNAYVG